MNLIKTNFYFAIMALAMFFTVSCEKEKKDNKKDETTTNAKAYIVNYGSYGSVSSTIDVYTEDDNKIVHDAYKSVNDVAYSSNAQSLTLHNGQGFLMGNQSDKIDMVNAKTLEQSVNPIETDIISPRYFVAKEATGYASCWGNVDDWSVVANSYIAVLGIDNKTVSKKIMLPGGPEGIIIANNKLYAALEFRDSVAVIRLDNHTISYIETPAIPQHIVKGKNGNLWVSLVSTYSDPASADSLGIGIIDPNTDQLTGRVPFSGISADGQLAVNNAKDKIYVMGKAAYPGTASSVYEIDVAGQSIGQSALITGENFNGIGCHPASNNIYVLISASSQETGSLKVYDSQGTLLDTQETGVAPQEVVFYQE
jgi:hypothetical protein